MMIVVLNGQMFYVLLCAVVSAFKVACLYPLNAWRPSALQQGGKMLFKPVAGCGEALQLPCGQCISCRLDRSRTWAARAVHEASLWPANSFITLTYNDDYFPEHGSLDYRDFQLFLKRFRKVCSGFGSGPNGDYPIRFYACGEYGATRMRPHWHACIFNFQFRDRKIWQRTSGNNIIYRSELLESLWPYGYSSIGDLTFQSAAYVARYITKKVTGDSASDHYTKVNESTGEIIKLTPEMTRMSLKPGIGFDWYQKYKHDIYNIDSVIINGKRCKPPRFYDKKFAEEYPFDFDQIKWQRELKRKELDLLPQPDTLSLAQVVKTQFNQLKRTLD